MKELLTVLIYGILNVALVLLVAPLFEGILRKVTARIQSRQGPPLLQPYTDLLKLLGKEDLETGASPRLQRFAACLALASVLAVAVLVPMGGAPPLGGGADAILLVYLLTLGGISTLLAALAAGSTYSLMGMSREMMAMMTLEPILAIAVLAGAVHTGSLQLDRVLLAGSVYAAGAFPWAGLILLGVALFSLQAFVGRIPFDVAEAETEIMEGPLVEYSGPKLALFKYAQMAKIVVYSALVVALFCPWGTGAYALDLALFLAKVLVLVVLITVVAATHARYRIDQAVRYYAGLLAVSFAALVLAVWGY